MVSLYSLYSIGSFSQILIDLIKYDLASTQAMQNEIKLLKEKVDYLENGNQRLHASYEARTQNLQYRLDTCENQNGAIFGIKPNDHICEREIEGIGQKSIISKYNNH